jgi:S1-C subfamily serine protease
MNKNLQEKIKEIKSSIVAIGFNPNPQQITIVGSGFAVSDNGKILTAAHLYKQLNEEQRKNLKANVMIEELENNLERYKWIPLTLANEKYRDDQNDLVVLKLGEEYKDTRLLKKLELGDSEKVEIGQDVYFIGFPYAAQLINEGFGVTLVVNKGTISNIKRDGVDPSHKRNWLIVDAISNPGNSGCPLIDIETNKVIGVMTIAFRTKSQTVQNLDIREPMHIAGAKPINLAKDLLK